MLKGASSKGAPVTNHQLNDRLGELIRRERETTNEILQLICTAMERRSYSDLGFTSMFDWLVRGFGYSASAAYRRIGAAKMLKAVPQLTRKLTNGKVNLTTVSKAESIIKAQEKATGRKVSKEQMAKAVDQIEQKSVLEAEQALFSMFPESAATINQERREVISENLVRHHMNLDAETSANLKRAREILSHAIPNATDAQIVAYALKFMLDRKDPLRKKPKPLTQSGSAAVPGRAKNGKSNELNIGSSNESKKNKGKAPPMVSTGSAEAGSKAQSERSVVQAAQAACQFQDPITGNVCGSRYQIEIDHIVPKAMGGTDEPENLRVLCREHNLQAAEQIFGKRLIDKFRRK